MSDDKRSITDERACGQISKAVAAALKIPDKVFIAEAKVFVVAYSFLPFDSVRDAWNDAVAVAKIMDPDGGISGHGFSINLFTVEGLQEFPKQDE